MPTIGWPRALDSTHALYAVQAPKAVMVYKAPGPIEPETAPSLGAQALQLQLQLQTRHALAKRAAFSALGRREF